MFFSERLCSPLVLSSVTNLNVFFKDVAPLAVLPAERVTFTSKPAMLCDMYVQERLFVSIGFVCSPFRLFKNGRDALFIYR